MSHRIKIQKRSFKYENIDEKREIEREELNLLSREKVEVLAEGGSHGWKRKVVVPGDKRTQQTSK